MTFRRVEFSLLKNGLEVVFPDSRDLFQDVKYLGNMVYASYSGQEPLADETYPTIPTYTITPAELISVFTPEEYGRFHDHPNDDINFYSQKLHFFLTTINSNDDDFREWLELLEENDILEYRERFRILEDGRLLVNGGN